LPIESEIIFFPIHQNNHWTLLVVDILKTTISYFDSLANEVELIQGMDDILILVQCVQINLNVRTFYDKRPHNTTLEYISLLSNLSFYTTLLFLSSLPSFRAFKSKLRFSLFSLFLYYDNLNKYRCSKVFKVLFNKL
jgi:hypothetical protein